MVPKDKSDLPFSWFPSFLVCLSVLSQFILPHLPLNSRGFQGPVLGSSGLPPSSCSHPQLWNLYFHNSFVFRFVKLYLFIYLFIWEEGREEERERNIDVREKHWLAAFWPGWGPKPQPWHVPWLEIQPVTTRFAGQRPTSWATPARVAQCSFKQNKSDHRTHLFKH